MNRNNVYFPFTDNHSGGRKFDDLSVGEFDNPQQFMDSEYNQSGDKDDKTINPYGFIQGYILSTTSEQDNIIRTTFNNINKNEEYKIFKTIVQMQCKGH